ncbi:arginine--tRNA ligase [Micromonospora sp. CPCC 206060]|uniref:arginine--tRNA ligase n=1 Tax=Micromonospora sp. CPCC 206060 TaxID=3122406 RepID=UPI003FA5DE18
MGDRLVRALRTALDIEVAPADTMVRPSTRAGVDYQCNLAMSLAKRVGRPPREVADKIVAALDIDDLTAPPEVTGPGFINFVVRDGWLATAVAGLVGEPRLGVPTVARPRRYALDYSSPNVAKEMHVGHLRSTIIGDAVRRLLEFAGHEVLPHNHLGDWGTPFGMLIEHLIDIGWDDSAHTITDLNGFYQAARSKFDADPEFADRSRLRVVQLQSGDERTLALWRQLVEESTRHFEEVYGLLGIGLRAGDIYGESFYNPMLADTIDDLERKGLTQVSGGAVCVFPPGFTNREGEPLPLILRKRDGGYGYHVTDLATVRYWVGERGATDLLYVVGTPQAQHFQMVFAACRQAGYLTDDNRTVHINFGTILGEDGKTIRTRAGGSIKLVELLTEAVSHAADIVAERSELGPEEQAQVARAVGIGAVKYADLSSDREKDYLFTWGKMLAREGNTSVYLQYANARIRSILRKAGQLPGPGTPVLLTAPAERALALKLLELPAAVDAALESYTPHRLCTYLYETAAVFTSFYETCPVLASGVDPQVRDSRLVLARLTSEVLVLGLDLIGIEAPERL